MPHGVGKPLTSSSAPLVGPVTPLQPLSISSSGCVGIYLFFYYYFFLKDTRSQRNMQIARIRAARKNRRQLQIAQPDITDHHQHIADENLSVVMRQACARGHPVIFFSPSNCVRVSLLSFFFLLAPM